VASRIEAVVFDLGETLLSEERAWGAWAEWLGVSRLEMFAALGMTIERRQHHRSCFEIVRPGIDLEAEERSKAAAGRGWGFEACDCYPDAAPCLARLRREGLMVGIAANQPSRVGEAISHLGLEADFVIVSGDIGVEKPDPRFFERVLASTGLEPGRVLYVGDRVDNDVVPAGAAGMRTAFVRRGPWAAAQATWPEAALADHHIGSLAELVAIVAARAGT
jgi:HAD superfamily hydrolase (TIGR01509 family)